MSDDKDCGCGISKIWFTGSKDPLLAACLWHDIAYTRNSFQQRSGWNRARVDNEFLRQMLAIAAAHLSATMKARAYVYYGIVRAVGWRWWEGK